MATRKFSNKRGLQPLSSNVVQDNIPVEVADRIYVGSIHAAFNQTALAEAGITHVVNIAGLPATFPKQFTYLTISLRDKDYANLLSCIPACNIFIEAALATGKVLVHCSYGRSRSPALVLAYLISSRGISFDEAYAYVKARRNVVSINLGFERQLRAYAHCKCDVHLAHEVLLRQRLQDMAKIDIQGMGYPGIAKSSTKPQPDASADTCALPTLAHLQQPARVRLLRPGSNAVQVIPPLRSMDLEYVCRNCQTVLFYSSNIVKPNIKSQSYRSVRFTPSNKSNRKALDMSHCQSTTAGTNPPRGETSTRLNAPGAATTSTSPFVPPTPASRSSGTTPKMDFDIPTSAPRKPTHDPHLVAAPSAQRDECKSEDSGNGDLDTVQRKSGKNIGLHVDISSPDEEPSTMEKTKWLERMHMLKVAGAADTDNDSDTIAKIADEDEAALKVMNDPYVLVEPLEWMSNRIQAPRGELSCVECGVDLGQFDWKGMDAAWGERLAPAFKIFSNRVGGRERPPTRRAASKGRT